MNLAISNIAWAPGSTSDAYTLMGRNGVQGLEIAPGLFFPTESDPFAPSANARRDALDLLHSHGLELVSMQSLLYGVGNARLFGNVEEQNAFTRGIERAIDLASSLDIPNIVMGSPKNRSIPSERDKLAAWDEAREIFRKLGDYARSAGVRIAMEPNPACYGTNFLTDFVDTLRFCRELSHPAIRMNFDTGALLVNDEFIHVERYFEAAKPFVSHVHISEPDLAPVTDERGNITRLFDALARNNYQGWVSVEMLAPSDGALATIERALANCVQSQHKTSKAVSAT